MTPSIARRRGRVAQFRDQTERYLAGLIDETRSPLRLQNGLYIQRYADAADRDPMACSRPSNSAHSPRSRGPMIAGTDISRRVRTFNSTG